MFKREVLLSCSLFLLALSGCNSTGSTSRQGATSSAGSTSESTPKPDSSKPNIAVIPKGTSHSYWKSVQAGAEKAGQELGANVVFKGPVQESDRAGQIKILEQFVSEGTQGIVLAPLDNAALVKPVRAAKGKKIPVIIIDSALKGKAPVDFASYIATDNRHGGVLAGEKLTSLLNGKGKVVLLRYQEGSASTNEREEGFLSALRKSPGITVISSNRYAGATSGEAKDSALNMVDKLKEADGIFAPNESSTLGMLLALRQTKLAGQKKFIGFDASPPLLDGLIKDDVNALVVQNPHKMGYEGVRVALAAIKGAKVPAKVDMGVAVVDKMNLNTPAIQEVLGGNK